MAQGVVLPAYIDEAGSRGLLRNIRPEQDGEFGLLCALLFAPDSYGVVLDAFTPPFERFCAAAPRGAKLHITDAFKVGNEEWRKVAEEVREEYLHLILTHRPMVIYAARRLGIARATFENKQAIIRKSTDLSDSQVRIPGKNRPSDETVEDELILSLALRLDAFADDMAGQVHQVAQVDLLFDETDGARRYESVIQRTRTLSGNTATVKGWDMAAAKQVEGMITIRAEAPFRLDTKFIGPIRVVGKAHPLVLAVDITANYLAHHLGNLASDAPLNAPSSVSGWRLEERVWGVSDNASEDRF